MNEETNIPRPSLNTIWLLLLAVGLFMAGGSTIYLGTQMENLRRQFVASQQDGAGLRAQLSQSDSELQNALQTLRDEMEQTQKDTNEGMAKAQSLAAHHADLVAGKMAQQAQELTTELGQVKASANEASTRLDGITTQVGTVRNDVDSARTDLAQTQTDLQRTRGDMGQISGLIATKAKEIQTLRDLGDRNIFEFTISRDAAPHKVGDIQVVVRKTDPRHNRFTLDVMADDKRVEKKDRSVNEPVQFYTSKARQPYELVVNEVQKDTVTGYLATPKVTTARN